VDDAEDEDDPIRFDHVAHDPMVPRTQPVERVAQPSDRLDGLPRDPTGSGDVGHETHQGITHARALVRREALEGPGGRR